MTTKEYENARARVLEMFRELNIALTPEEENRIEVADFGRGQLEKVGLELLTYVNTDRVCAKELALFPWQMCPEHYHPSIDDHAGKEETFRCRWGTVYLYVPGEPTDLIKGRLPLDQASHCSSFHEIVLDAGEQYTLSPDTKHWFQAGPEGAIVSEFSTTSTDENDVFTDPRIVRAPQVRTT